MVGDGRLWILDEEWIFIIPKSGQPFLIGEMLQSPHNLLSPPLDSLQQLLIFLEVGSPKLDTGLQMGSY